MHLAGQEGQRFIPPEFDQELALSWGLKLLRGSSVLDIACFWGYDQISLRGGVRTCHTAQERHEQFPLDCIIQGVPFYFSYYNIANYNSNDHDKKKTWMFNLMFKFQNNLFYFHFFRVKCGIDNQGKNIFVCYKNKLEHKQAMQCAEHSDVHRVTGAARRRLFWFDSKISQLTKYSEFQSLNSKHFPFLSPSFKTHWLSLCWILLLWKTRSTFLPILHVTGQTSVRIIKN